MRHLLDLCAGIQVECRDAAHAERLGALFVAFTTGPNATPAMREAIVERIIRLAARP